MISPAGNETTTPAEPAFDLGTFPIDEYRPLKVVVIGAGLSGIFAGIRFRQYINNLDLTIYEKLDDIGGTWYANKYPGLCCDVTAPCYQYSFDQKSANWSGLYTSGPDVLSYLQGVADRYKLRPYIKLSHELLGARYDEPSGKWYLKIRRRSETTGELEEFEDWAHFLFTAVGILSRPKWPDIPGIGGFGGTIVHSGDWNLGGETWEEDVKEWGNKNVGVIGIGSSGLQIVSALQSKVGNLHQFARGGTWVSPPFGRDKFSELLSRDITEQDVKFTDAEKKRFEDPVQARELRLALEHNMNSMHLATQRGSPVGAQIQERIKAHMVNGLAKKPQVAEQLIPDYTVTSRRLTPAIGYLDALCQDNVHLATKGIKAITENGIVTADGEHVELDVIICATGFDTSLHYPFPLTGRGGLTLHAKWHPHPTSYLSVCVDGFPNWFFACGPNCAIATGSVVPIIEAQVGYAVRAAAKLQRERLRSVEVRAGSVRDFERYIESYFPKTFFSDKVASWYKAGKEDGRVIAIWPGSCLHVLRALKHPRWEDFKYERQDPSPSAHSLYWLGNGMTRNDGTLSGTGDRAWYLREGYVDVPPVPEDDDEEAST